jgi:hypothetical protein
VTVSDPSADTKVVYAGAGQPLPDPNLTSTTSSGTIFLVNVPPGMHVVQAHYRDFPADKLEQNVLIRADEVSLGLIAP